jgi:hypothetical protein
MTEQNKLQKKKKFPGDRVYKNSHIWRHVPVILALRRLRQEGYELKASLGCIVSLRPANAT